ncbi:HAD-IIA family hydrolase [Timonella sp. A28]|uniref:HAD-IIA family hydrolase n=1 Tax=Timonella sp. A28 TaxID=3442640 RepID=UPI003EBF1327
MSDYILGSHQPLAASYPLALVDLDGVAYKGHLPIEYAAESLVSARNSGLALVFVTNNASREPEDVAGQLTGLDIPTSPHEVMTAAQACARLLRSHVQPGAKVLVVGGAGLLTAVQAEGYTVVSSTDDEPDAVAQGFHPSLGWEHLAEGAYAVSRGAIHVASNLDLSLPTARGYAPGNGALVGAVQAATGVKPFSAGKPSPAMYDMALEKAGVSSALVVGDRLDTDLAGARAGGYHGLHVLTGVNSARDDILALPQERPHFIARDLRGLLETQPEVTRENEWFICNDARVRILDGALNIDSAGEPDELDIVRASCNAVWSFVDEGGEFDNTSIPHFSTL